MVEAIKLVIVALLISLVPSIVVTLLKGRQLLLLAGLMGIFPLLWAAAVKPANPGSWWAKRFYGAEKLERDRRYQAAWAES